MHVADILLCLLLWQVLYKLMFGVDDTQERRACSRRDSSSISFLGHARAGTHGPAQHQHQHQLAQHLPE